MRSAGRRSAPYPRRPGARPGAPRGNDPLRRVSRPRPAGRGDRTRVFWGVRACARAGHAGRATPPPRTPRLFLQTVRAAFPIGNFPGLRIPAERTPRVRVSSPGRRGLKDLGARDTPNAAVWGSRGRGRDPGRPPAGEFGTDKKARREEEFLPEQTHSLFSSKHKSGVPGTPKSGASEPVRKPNARNFGPNLRVKFMDDTGVPAYPDFSSVKGRRCLWVFRRGENGWLCGSPQPRFWGDDSEKRVWGSAKPKLSGDDSEKWV